MARLFKSAAGRGLPESSVARRGQEVPLHRAILYLVLHQTVFSFDNGRGAECSVDESFNQCLASSQRCRKVRYPMVQHSEAITRRLAAWAAVAAAVLGLNADADAQVTLNVVNNFAAAKGGTYFGGHVESQDVYVYFTGIGSGDVTYNGGTAVTSGSGIQFSSITGGTFSLNNAIAGARVYAVLGTPTSSGGQAPLTLGPSGPDPSTVTYPYSFIELTTTTGGDADQSFLNQVSYPTRLSNGSQTNDWSDTTTAQSIATAFNTKFPSAPYAPASGTVPGSGHPYNPYLATTVARSAGAVTTPISGFRVVAASNVNNPAASPPPQAGTGYTNVPGFNEYLGWLQTNQPGGGWQVAYNAPGFPDSTYTGRLQVTGSNGNYGLGLSNFTYGGTFTNGSITGGTSVTGTITYAANNSQQTVFGVADYTANWTDLAIFSANDPTGGAITTTGDLGTLSVASVSYTVSASIGPGILGSDAYISSGSNTDVFFKTSVTPSNILSNFFANSQFGGSSKAGFYDQYWHAMLEAGGVSSGTYAGYFTPYDDHFSNLGVLMPSDSGTLTWELGNPVAVPEPSVVALMTVAAAALGGRAWRKRRVGA